MKEYIALAAVLVVFVIYIVLLEHEKDILAYIIFPMIPISSWIAVFAAAPFILIARGGSIVDICFQFLAAFIFLSVLLPAFACMIEDFKDTVNRKKSENNKK